MGFQYKNKKYKLKYKNASNVLIMISIVLTTIGILFGFFNQNTTALNEPKHIKTLTSNGDGTYEIALSIEGAIQENSTAANANVLIVYDVSNSMKSSINTIYSKHETGRYGKSGDDYFNLYVKNSYSYSGYSQISNDTTEGPVYRRIIDGGQYDYVEYTDDRYVTISNRSTASEKALYDFAKQLYSHNKTETAKNVEMALITFSSSSNSHGEATFGNNDSAIHLVQNWTNSESTFLSNIYQNNSAELSYSGGTNWEAGLQYGLNNILSKADGDQTFVIFMTDGGPTFNVSKTDANGNNYAANGNGYGNGSTVEAGNMRAAMDEAFHINNYNTKLEQNETQTYDQENSNTTFYGIYTYASPGSNSSPDYLDDLVYYAHNNGSMGTRKIGTSSDNSGIEDYYFNAEDSEQLENAIATILKGILKTVGISEVEINDGTTQNVKIDSGSVNLLDIDETSYTYWMSKDVLPNTVEADNGYTYYTTRTNRNDGTIYNIFFRQNEADSTKIDAFWIEDTERHEITVNGSIKNVKDENGTVTGKNVEVQWLPKETGDKSSELFFDNDPPEASVVTQKDKNGNDNSRVVWDLSTTGVLLDGVTYTVKFDVWKTQYVFDLIADLRNKNIKYSDLKAGSGTKYAGLQDYIIGYGCDLLGEYCNSYSVNTNTDAKVTYVDSSVSNDSLTLTYTPPTGIDIVSETINIHKNWLSDLDDKDSKINSVDVDILKDGEYYITRTLTKENRWKNDKDAFIAPGLITMQYEDMKDESGNIIYEEDGVTPKQTIKEGTLDIKDVGHDYSFAEPGTEAYNWQLVSETVRPMVINGVLTELIRMDEEVLDTYTPDGNPILNNYSIPTEMKNDPTLLYATSNRGNHFIRLNDINGVSHVYLISGSTSPTIEAHNYRRSNLNIKKIVDGSAADKDKYFKFNININDNGYVDGEELYFSVWDTEKNSYVDLQNHLITNTTWEKEILDDLNDSRVIDESGWTGFYYAANNTPLTVELKTSHNLRFTNLTSKATYVVEEQDLEEGFVFDQTGSKVEGIYGAKYTKEDGTVVNTLKDLELKRDLDYEVSDKKITGNITMTNSSYTVQMKNIYEKVNVEMTKIWDDDNNRDDKRPRTITINLYADGVKQDTRTINLPSQEGTIVSEDGNTWKYIWKDLPRFRESTGETNSSNNQEIIYTVDEDVTPDGYTKTIEGNVITNTHTPEKTSVTVTKIWDDANNQDGIRPPELKVTLSNGDSVTLNEKNQWTGTITGLIKYENGKEINYTWTEESIEGYTLTNSTKDGTITTLTNTHTPETIEVSVKKVWDDEDNRDGIRPPELKVTLSNGDSVTLNEDNKWTDTISNLPKYANGEEIEYTWIEDTIEKYTHVTPDKVKDNITTITNKHTPSTIEISGTKIWDDANNQDGKRPESIIVQLFADGKLYDRKTIKASDDWSYTFESLPEYKTGEVGKKIVYTIDESNVPEGYKKTIEGNNIKNTHTPETVEVSVKKVWDDADNQDGKRPTELIVSLSNGDSVTLNEDNKWTDTISNLPKYANGKEIEYTWTENKVEGYTLTSTKKDGTVTTITNKYTPETTEVSVKKVWDDSNNQDGLRPSELVVTLSNGDTVKLNEKNKWTDKITNLPKYANGQEIEYTWNEDTVEGYTLTNTSKDGIVTTLTNTHTPSTTTITGTKIWDDKDNQDGIRPSEVVINLFADGKVYDKKTVTADDNWSYTFDNLPEYKKGEEGHKIVYTIDESNVPTGYSKTVEGNNIKNTHVPETTEVSVKKVWDDSNNQDGLRPSELVVTLSNGNTVTLNSDNKWTASISNLPKYSEGREIIYSWTENNIEGYTHVAPDVVKNNETTIVNVHIPSSTSINGTKTWDDSDNQDGKRPSEIVINLLADGKVYDKKTITENDNWSYTFDNLPEYKKGEEGHKIVYTIDESSVPTGYTKEVTDNNIKNTHIPETVEVSVKKVWDDSNNQDGKRPEQLTVTLSNGDTIILSEENQWTGTISNLPKYANGKEIEYTWTEDQIEGYKLTNTSKNGLVTTLTNTHAPETITINGEKTWDDANDQDGKRPDSITVILTGIVDGKTVKKYEATVVDKNGNWDYEFKDIPKYSNGIEISYSISENKVPNYEEPIISGYDITNKYSPETTSVMITKVWNDDNNRDTLRPTNIKVNLISKVKDTKILTMTYELSENNEDVQIIDNGNTWTYTINNLPKYSHGELITYEVEEDTTYPEGVFTNDSKTGYVSNVSGNASKGFVITNTHEPEKIKISGKKVWNDSNNQDGKRPENVIVKLKVGDSIISTTTTDSEGNFEFTNINKYENGVEINYNIEEVPVEGYTGIITGDFKTGYTITNTHETIKTSIEGIKYWNDSNNKDGLRPQSIIVHLLKNGKRLEEDKYLEVTSTNNWEFKFDNLDAYENGKLIEYDVEEDEVAEYKMTKLKNGNIIVITNTHDSKELTISGEKTWNHDGNDFEKPESITVKLTGIDSDKKIVVEESKKVSKEDSWKYEFTKLPEYKDGKKITYTISEDAIIDYTAEIKGYDILNTYTPQVFDIDGQKTWNDADNQDGKRPKSINIKLIGKVDNNIVVEIPQEVKADSEGNWKYHFKDVKKYANGKEITYTIEEETIDGYKMIKGEEYNISNEHTPETITYTVSKVWDDEDNNDNLRPDHIDVTLLQTIIDEEGKKVTSEYKKQTIKEVDGLWTYTFENLPKYYKGNQIEYTIFEDSVSKYITSYSTQQYQDNNITQVINNTHTPELTTIKGYKNWEDNDNQDGLRPKIIKVQLYIDGTPDRIIEVSSDTNWYYEFDNLRVYNDKKKVTYTVKEIIENNITETDSENENYSSTVEQDEEGNFVITNKHTPQTTSIIIKKIWNDVDNKDNIRPNSIKVNVYKNKKLYKQVELTEELGWMIEITDLPKYENGKIIEYTIEEEIIPGYEVKYETNENLYTITNTHNPEPDDTVITPPKTGTSGTNVVVYENIIYYDDKKKLFTIKKENA